MTVLPFEVTSVGTGPISRPQPLWRRVLRRPLAVISLAYLAVLIFCVAGAPLVTSDSPNTVDLFNVLSGPSGSHPLGTDSLGRDILSRLLYGGRPTLVGTAVALLVASFIGVGIGVAAGYVGSTLDRVVSWVADLLIAFPAFILLLVVLSVFPYNMTIAMICLGVVLSPAIMRVTRSAVLAIREDTYLDAAKTSGVSQGRIILRHVLPRVAGPIIVQVTLTAAVILVMVAALGFLGLTTRPPAASWGSLVQDASLKINQQPWLLVPSGGVIFLTVLALGLLGDALRDAVAERWAGTAARPKKPAKTSVTAQSGETVSTEAEPGELLSVRGLSIVLRQGGGAEVPLVTGVDLDIDPGQAVALVGESGCGKTITTRAILDLLPHAAARAGGTIAFEGKDLTNLKPRDFARVRGAGIGLISQEPMASLDPTYTVGFQVAEAVRTHDQVGRGEARRRAVDLLDQVGLHDPEAVARSYPHQLSGGMAQRVAIARALAGHPRLLIADEPTTALDVTIQAGILDLLNSLRAQTGMALLLVTHDWGVVAELCETALVMYAGQVVERASVSQLLDTPRHPYTEALLAADPHRADLDSELRAIVGSVPEPGRWPQGCRFNDRCPYVQEDCRQGPLSIQCLDDERVSRCLHSDELDDKVPA